MPQPSSTMLEFWVRIEDVQRGLVSLEEIHSAIRGVIFQRTIGIVRDYQLIIRTFPWKVDGFGEVIYEIKRASSTIPAPVVPPARLDVSTDGDCRIEIS